MDTNSIHVLVELYDCDAALLDDVLFATELVEHAALAIGATVVHCVSHRFSPQGVSIVLVLQESHFSLHTWPEVGYAAADFFTCGQLEPDEAIAALSCGMKAKNFQVMKVNRGRPDKLLSVTTTGLKNLQANS